MVRTIVFENIKAKRIEKLNTDVLAALKQFDNLILGGGAVRDALFNSPINDYDLFLKYGGSVSEVRAFFESKGYALAFACPEGKLFTYVEKDGDKIVTKVQIILKRQYYDWEDLINSFDFSVSYFAMVYDTQKGRFTIRTSREAVRDVKNKTIRLVNLEYPSSTINRLYKYRARGYYVGGVIKEIVVSISNMPNYDPENDTLYVD